VNEEQIKSAVRWFITTFGGAIAGWFAAKGWLTADQVTAILDSSAFVSAVAGFIVALIGFVWGMIAHTRKNAVAVVAAISPETKVVTTPELAAEVARPDVFSISKVQVVSKDRRTA
jgi:hypothetical protein